jgi:hypothetical protein
MLSVTDAYELILPELADEGYEEPRLRGGPLVPQEMRDQKDIKDVRRLEQLA